MVAGIADRVAVMYAGKVVETGTTAQIFYEHKHPYTEALFSAIPIPDPDVKMKRIILKGSLPSPANPPKGCKFHTRCKYCTEICTHVVPDWEEVTPNHFVACHHKLHTNE